MKRKQKFYVSTTDGVLHGGIKRLTDYFTDRIDAENEFSRLRIHYNKLFLRTLMTDNKTRKTLKFS